MTKLVSAVSQAGTLPRRRPLSDCESAQAQGWVPTMSPRSTVDLREAFAVPWDYARTLARVRSGQYAAALLEDATWAVDQTVAILSSLIDPQD